MTPTKSAVKTNAELVELMNNHPGWHPKYILELYNARKKALKRTNKINESDKI